MNLTVLITGASTGIGDLTAKALAAAGHTVYASMRDPEGRNAEHTENLCEAPKGEGGDLRVVELDVQSQNSADAAVRTVRTVREETGGLDVVINNAGHLYVGYVEAFTAEDVAHLFDINRRLWPFSSRPERTLNSCAACGREAGLDVGALTPTEIVLGSFADIVAHREGKLGLPLIPSEAARSGLSSAFAGA